MELNLPDNPDDLKLPAYHKIIIQRREVHEQAAERRHKELMEINERIAYALNDIVKALIIRKKQ